MSAKDPVETHLMVVWEKARKCESRILEDLSKHVRIRRCFEIRWSAGSARRNFMRFYGAKLPAVEAKVSECGIGPFLLVVMDVPNPDYTVIVTSRGHEIANRSVFSLKARYREWTGRGGSMVHATNSPEEFDHDLTMLLGVGADEFGWNCPAAWDGRVEALERDVLGEGRWKDESELSRALRVAPRHVVLRGIDENGHIAAEGEDVVIFTDCSGDWQSLLGGRADRKTRNRRIVRVGGREIAFTVLDSALGYYDPMWSENMLSTREWRAGCYRPDPVNSKYERIYRTLFLESAAVPGFDYGSNLLELRRFLSGEGYNIPCPRDATARFNAYLLTSGLTARRLEQRFFLRNLRQIQFPQSASRQGLLYFRGESDSGGVFVKTCRDDSGRGSVRDEFSAMELAWKHDASHFPKPLMYCDVGGLTAISMEYLEGCSLAEFLGDGEAVRRDGDRVAEELCKIVGSLASVGLVHRDFRPDNLMIGRDGSVRLLDFQFAVRVGRYREYPFYRHHPECLRPLGAECNGGDYVWDDARSLVAVLEKLPATERTVRCREWAAEQVGKLRVRFPVWPLLRYRILDVLVGLVPFPEPRHRLRKRLRGDP